MKKLIFIIIFLFVGILSQAQILKFESEAVSYKTFDIQNNRFDEWEPWEPTRVIIIVNIEKETVDVYSQYEQHYIFLSVIDNVIQKDRKSYIFDALDEDGKRCSIEMSILDTGVQHIYVRWSNLQIVYQIRKL